MTKEEFLKWVKVDANGCWLWQRSTRGAGYGQCNEQDEPSRIVSRMVYKMYKGPIPDGYVIMHTCDVPLCTNPDHLVAGTHKANSQDMAAKGRTNHSTRTKADYNMVAARQALADKYKDAEFRAAQSARISAGHWRKKHAAILWAYGVKIGEPK